MEDIFFIKKHCKQCKEICEKGLFNGGNFVKCGDTLIEEVETKTEKNNDNYELRKTLLKIGIYSNYEGYRYILKAVKILQKQEIHTNVTTLYEMICKNTNAKSNGSVERAIRYCISQSYKKNPILKNIYKTKPTNAAFLYDLAFNMDIYLEEIENIDKNK